MKKALLGMALLGALSLHAQLLQQDFQSSTALATYSNATTPSNGQFNAISTSGSSTTVAIGTSAGNNFLSFNRSGGNAGSFSRTTDFSTVPATLLYRVDITVNSTAAATTAAVFQVGSGFGTANSAEANASTYARFALNTLASGNGFVVRDVTAGTNSAVLSGTQTILWAMNNSGTAQTYTSPLGTDATVGNDKADIWAGTTLLFDDVDVQTATQTITDLKFTYAAGSGTIDLDKFLLDPIPPTTTTSAANEITSSAFTARWTAVSGVTGYRIDVSPAADFSSFVSGYQNRYVSGASTNTLLVTGLAANTTYYYRVRSASSYTVGEFGSGNSNVQSVTTAVGGALPVKLSGFGGTTASGGVELNWSTITESGVAYYTLERGADAKNFTAIAKVNPGRNNGAAAAYTYLDPVPVTGSNYYRLRVTEQNGQVSYSGVFRLLFGVVSSVLQLYPNPLQGHVLTVQAGRLARGVYKLQVVSGLGQVMETRSLYHAGGFFNQTLILPGLKAGVYTLQLTGEGEATQQQLLVY